MQILILGSNSAIPTSKRFPTSHILTINQNYYLFDCGEGTQIQLRRYKIKIQRIKAIFITHLHGDHYFGLFGLLNTMHLLGRNKELTIFAPKELEDIINLILNVAKTNLNYKLQFFSLSNLSEEIYSDNSISIKTFPLYHRIQCNGFYIKEKTSQKKLKKELIKKYEIPISELEKIRFGASFILPNGKIISHEQLTIKPPEPSSYAFCTDTIYDERILPHIKGVNTLYHESTFLEDMIDRAKHTFHSTAKQAATMAVKSNAKQLILGHYSARYTTLDNHLQEAREVFKNTILGEDGKIIEII